ncbi:hypothetical protein D3C76_1636120 [compost metagenome]
MLNRIFLHIDAVIYVVPMVIPDHFERTLTNINWMLNLVVQTVMDSAYGRNGKAFPSNH